MICNRRLTSRSPEMNVVKQIYESSFPADERRDYDALLQLIESEPAFVVEAICCDDNVVGLITSWSFDEWRYIEHFAIDVTMRGKGVGETTLVRFLSSDLRPVVLEVEPPIDDVTRRRVGFYERLGFVLHAAYRYIQPPYDCDKNAVELCLMTYGAADTCNLDEVTQLLHSRVYGAK